MVKQLFAWKNKAFEYLSRGLWGIRLDDLSGLRRARIKWLRVVVLAVRGFSEDRCLLRASALTFYVMLSIVPVFALAFGIAKGAGLAERLTAQLLATFPAPAQQQVMSDVIDYANKLLAQTKTGLVAGIGFFVLLWAVLRVMGNIENSFNAIWGVREGRNWPRMLSDYLSVMLVAPVLVVLSGSATVFVSTELAAWAKETGLQREVGILIFLGLKLLPYAFVSALLVFVYALVPNTKVSLRSALLAGIFAGVLYQWLQLVFIKTQFGLSRFNEIYGTFAALPLFLIWLQASWIVVLFGAEMCYAHQNVDYYEHEPLSHDASHRLRRLFAVRIAQICVRRFQNAEPAPTAEDICHVMGIPVRIGREIVNELVDAGVLAETAGDKESDESRLLPAISTDRLDIKEIVDRFESRGIQDLPFTHSPEFDRIAEALEAFGKKARASEANLLLKDIG